MTRLTFRQWLHFTFAWLLLTAGFVLWLWGPGLGSTLGLLLMVFTGYYAFTTRQERRGVLGRQVGKRELIGIALASAVLILLALLTFFLPGEDAENFDVKKKLREPPFASALYALMVGPTVWRWHRRLARAKSEAQPGIKP